MEVFGQAQKQKRERHTHTRQPLEPPGAKQSNPMQWNAMHCGVVGLRGRFASADARCHALGPLWQRRLLPFYSSRAEGEVTITFVTTSDGSISNKINNRVSQHDFEEGERALVPSARRVRKMS